MTKFTKNVYRDDTITLDNNDFENCEFYNCRLVFHGTGLFNMQGCKIVDCQWPMEDHAQITLQYLAATLPFCRFLMYRKKDYQILSR